ncbi:hypothetical protein LDJ55_09610 [Klebsiella pneumoniae]|uniref:hypothetical protein n=1 Tax=Klebsiella pneumoniae TaxID=573 RepID=UPI000E2C3E9A|nr:hypothetical protein [Klebsiella pneumoniae]UCM17362.1 hypothetical protein LDJ55_09610 [Klebsiella pneumoniae]SWB41895.1 Uncharacterised protein [Klebsiella pneumoniae]VVL04581.1 Uncharacterised protein [Klebsiella pneumoniae]GKI72003.1 hypothetical protein NUBL2899_49570 [Klebsiella pneumoniae]GKI94362.1 hypothetical protein NUBL2908_48960 [Klebsiella pneumoniae]
MSTYKTKNPLGSAAVKDLYDNAENVDKFVNDRTKEELEDRLGVLRKTWHGMEMIFSRFIDYITGRGEQAVAAIGWQELGNWAVGLAVDNRQQIVYYNGSWYKYLGELEHVIAGDSPENDGGVWSAANPTGKWSNIGDAALRSNLGSSESDLGGALVNIGQATVRDVVRANILSYMSKTDQLAIKGVVGTEVVADYALRSAINDGVTILEFPPVPGIYVFGQDVVTLPAGFSFEGGSRRTYTISSDASFNNAGTVFRLFNGASAIFKLTSRHTFRRVIFDGRNKSVRFMQGDDQTQWCRFYDCGVHRWYIGIGGSSTNGYSATLIFSGGTISNNTIGVKNVIDSLFLGATINANDTDGVQLLTGANNNAFIGVRNEWNNGDNYYGYGCKRILIQGELIDRAGKRAVAAVGGAQFTLSGVAVQRSGRLATEGTAEDAHYYIEGDTSSIIETSVHTTTGANDDGSGRQSPSYILSTGGSSSDSKSFIASASNLSGYTGTSWLRSGVVATLSVLGCSGVEDVKNFGFRRISDGVQYLGDAVSALSLSGAGNTATLTFKTTAQAFSRYSSELLVRNLEIRARNNTSTGSVAYYSVNLIISREQAAAAIAVDTASVRTFATLSGGTWGITSASPTGVSLSFAISEDGTTLTVTLTAIDSASRIINARLRA